MSLSSLFAKAVSYVSTHLLGTDKGQKAADKIDGVAVPYIDAFTAAHKAEAYAAIDAVSADLKARKVASSAVVRDQLEAAVRARLQAKGVSGPLLDIAAAKINALPLPDVTKNVNEAVDELAARAKAVVGAL